MRSILYLFLIVLICSCGKSQKTVDITLPENADEIEQLAAAELSTYLGNIYEDYQFRIVTESKSKNKIFIGVKDKLPEDQQLLSSVPQSKEGFSVFHTKENIGVITSEGSKGLLYGVYELMEKLGYSFVFSGDFAPPKKEVFDFDRWNLTNEPLVEERTVFNWHNFLSGCTAWDYEDWVLWINQAQKMGYNTIMVHGYANNPMFTFEYKGMKKPVGYLTNSAEGRDWSTEHVNDVRRLPGGHVFDDAVFGSEASKVPEEEKVAGVQHLMKRVFQHAKARGIRVNIALDFDIVAAIPQEMMEKIPETDKFKVNHRGIGWMGEKAGEVWLPRPDKTEGYNYYKKQVADLLKLYPEIDKYVLWRRAAGSVWHELKRNEMPKEWQKEFLQKIKEKPELAELPKSEGVFAQSKMAYAYQQAFRELNREDVDIAYGTWQWKSLKPMHAFYPDFTTIYILDSEVIRGDLHLHNQAMIDDIASWSKAGKIIPVIWPHHDDGAYIGAPLAPFEDFNETLKELKSNGFGVIHWMTRPFDSFFIHHSRQVMANSENQSLNQTLKELGEKWFGSEGAETMSWYLTMMNENMPVFGRETSSEFIDKPHYDKFDDPAKVIDACNQRLDLLEKVNREVLSKDQEQMYLFYKNLEIFVRDFNKQQQLYLSFLKEHNAGNIETSKRIADQFNPEEVLEHYAKTIQYGYSTKGEKGLLFSMGLRWLPHFISLKQLVGKESIRINFGHTSHEALAQMPGRLTYLVNRERSYWKVLGEKETGKTVVDINSSSEDYKEIYRNGILVDTAVEFPLNAFTSKKALSAGQYKLKVLLFSRQERGTVEYKINNISNVVEFEQNGGFEVNITVDGTTNPIFEIIPQKGESILCGLILSHEDVDQ
ncbi:hypothetical protein D1614_00285 [Maribellus luteus]|uniref:Alpha glucuronidase N-terminal domain-containing protein n=1 Tax=Maribellus luteus TaxID=2305463 RepID=A0A399T6B7_9BACT|nr:alpha-glucuronidase family glycosyl hydrolase [Maribellus luteus]RIJ50415.1 hypothetical protein D1614_00285 [Maribellus luteus]